MVKRVWKTTPGQLAILQLRPASGDQYLPKMRSNEQKQDNIILDHIRTKKIKLWGPEYSVALALLGVASNPDELAETAFLLFPTRESPNQCHFYQGN